jgi:hypothetical protein
MAVTTDQSTTGLRYNNGRNTAVTSTGRRWIAYVSSELSIVLRYSDNNWATSSVNSNGGIPSVTSTSAQAGLSFFIDEDDHAHIVYVQSNYLRYRRMANIGASTSWGAVKSVDGTYTKSADIVAFRDGSSWIAAIAASTTSGSNVFILKAVDTTITGPTTLAGSLGYASIDFNHTGDGKTIAGGLPHLYVASVAGSSLRFRKYTYSGGTYTVGTNRDLDSSWTKRPNLSLAYDGTRSVVAYAKSAEVYIAERDEGDTTTIIRTPPSLGGGNVENVGVTYGPNGNIYLWASGSSARALKRTEFDRAAGTWSSWVTINGGGLFPDAISLKRGYSGSRIEGVYIYGYGSPYQIQNSSISLNAAPFAPTWVSPADNSYQDRDSNLTLDWDFVDGDAGDSQSAYALSKSVDGAVLEYWNASTSAWVGAEVKNPTANTFTTLGSGWATVGESVLFAAKTWDASDAAGPYGSGLTVNAGTANVPVLDAPATSAVLGSSSADISWTVAAQAAYQVRVLSSADAELFSTGKITGAVTEVTLEYVFSDGQTGLKVELTTWNAFDIPGIDTNTGISVSYTPPATPVLTVTANAAGYMSVAIADPTPAGSQPTVDTHDVYVRVAVGGRQVGERPVGGDGIRISTGVATNGTYPDHGAATGTDFEYRTLARAGTATTYSEWT